MDKSNIYVLLKIIELESYQKTADELGYTHAGIRYIVQKTEEELGIKLFYRRYGGVSLTNEGRELLPWMKQFVSSEDALMRRASELRDMNTGTIRIASFHSVSVLWLPGMIHTFHQKYPGMRFEIEIYSEDHLGRDMLRNGEVDCGLYVLPVEEDLRVYPLARIPLVAIISPNHPLAKKKRFSMSALGKYPYVAGAGEEMIEDLFARHNARPDVQFSANNDDTMMALVSQGLGYCIVPQSQADSSPVTLVSLPLEKPEYLDMAIVVRGDEPCTRSVQAFVDHAVEWIKQKQDR